MKNLKMSTVIILLLISTTVLSKTTWITSYDDALKTARAVNKPILIDFWATWCGPCSKMDSDVWNKEDVQLLMQNYVNLKVDIDVETIVARKYNVRGIPNVFIIDGWGNILYSSVGYKDKNTMKKVLKNFSVNMSGINQSLSILEKSEDNVYSNLRVAQKYQDTGFVLEDTSQKGFLHQSDIFLKKSLKLIEDDDNLIEKVGLLILLNKSYRGGEKGTLKSLDKKFTSVAVANTALYNYVEFVCYTNLKNQDKAQVCYDKLTELNSSVYLKKANYLIKTSKP